MTATNGRVAPRLHGGFAWLVYSSSHDRPHWSLKTISQRRISGLNKIGRSGEIRTPGPLVPNQMRYQAALHSDGVYLSLLKLFFKPSSIVKPVLLCFLLNSDGSLLDGKR